MAWTLDMLQLFYDVQIQIISSPILAHYDPTKSTFLNTNWSTKGMVWISMQPADDMESQATTK